MFQPKQITFWLHLTLTIAALAVSRWGGGGRRTERATILSSIHYGAVKIRVLSAIIQHCPTKCGGWKAQRSAAPDT